MGHTGWIVEMVDLRYGCKRCGKIWADDREKDADPDVECDMDYNEFVYFHRCEQ